MKTLLVGIDVATVPAKVGLARSIYVDGRVQLEEAMLCTGSIPAETIANWLLGSLDPVLLAIERLWAGRRSSPRASPHQAGEWIELHPTRCSAHHGSFIQQKLSKTPLDVGADRIARTAHAALALLGDLRHRLDAPIPLAWSPELSGIAAIEVYPAATLVAHGMPSSAYKAPDQESKRREILAALQEWIDVGTQAQVLQAHADAPRCCRLSARGQGLSRGPSDVAYRPGGRSTRGLDLGCPADILSALKAPRAPPQAHLFERLH
jgi:hypothetical protein